MKIKEIFTIGYGDKDFPEFLNLLKEVNIELVIDVRSFPQSKWSEYEKESLRKNLPKAGVDYLHLEDLGGYRDEGYREYMKTEEFRKAFNRLKELSEKQKIAIMCLESYPSGCHRRFIAQKLKDEGWKVVHLVGKNGKQETLT